MPFATVSDGSLLPKLTGTYTLEVLRIEEMEDGQFGARMKWVFSAVDEDGDEVTWDNGDPYEWFQQSGATLGPRSTARKWAEALLGRELRVGDSGEDVMESLIGRKARALVDVNEGGYSRIVGLTPIKARAKGSKVRAAREDEDEDALPF